MTVALQSALVRIWDQKNKIAGAGFLVTERHVLTCAHVVSYALDKLPTGPVQLDFPFVKPGERVTAVVTLWQPKRPDGTGDIARLELQASPPDGARPLRLVAAPDTWNHPFRAFGFPDGRDNGVYASGVMRDRTVSGHIQIEDVKTPGYSVQPGFSGTPVWDEKLHGVIGMVALAESKTEIKAAFIIPTDKLVEVWPDLRSQVVSSPAFRFFPNDHDRLPQHYVPRLELLESARASVLDASRNQESAPILKLDVLHGMGGVGKSVTARALCDDLDIQTAFPDGILWATLGQRVTEAELRAKLRDWIYAFDRTITESAPSHDSLKNDLSNILRERRCLLVLDDVWRQSDANWFLVDAAHSQYLLTSRDAAIAEAMGANVHSVPVMALEEAASLLSAWAKRPLREEHPDLTTRIIQRLGCLPLALKLAGSQLRTQDLEQWLETFQIRKLRSRRPETVHDNLYDTLALSLDSLSADNRHLYLALAIFKREPMPTVAVARLWGAASNLNANEVSELLHDLDDRALLELVPLGGGASLHDLLHDYITDELGQNGRLAAHHTLLDAYRQTQVGDGWANAPDDGYLFANLPYHLVEAGLVAELQQLMLDPNWLRVHETHQPSLHNYLIGLRYALEAAVNQGLEGIPLLVAYGLIKGTLTTAAYKISSEQIKQMIESGQVDLILQWADRLPQTIEWFRVDLIQLAGEVALMNGQTERAQKEFKRVTDQLRQVASTHIPELLTGLAVNYMMLKDKASVRNLLTITEELPDSLWISKPNLITFLQEVYTCLDQGTDPITLLRAYDLQESPAIARLTDEQYVTPMPDSRLRGVKSTIDMFGRWAETLQECGESDLAQSAFDQAEKMLALITPDEPRDQTETLVRLLELAVLLDRPHERIEYLIQNATNSADQIIYPSSRILAQINLANLFTRLGYTYLAIQLLKHIEKQLQHEPNLNQMQIWLMQIAPCAPLFRDPVAYIASHIPDEQLSARIILAWRANLGDVDAAQALITSLESKPDDVLNGWILNAIIPFLRTQPPDAMLLKRVSRLSLQALTSKQQWLQLSKVLTVVHLDEPALAELLQTLKLEYAQTNEDERQTLALQMAPLLVHCCTIDPDWSLAVLQNTFLQQGPYHRSVILLALERFAPIILKLAGKATFIKVWEQIVDVEGMFFANFW